MSTTGTSASSFLPSDLRPIRRCNWPKGSTVLPCFQGGFLRRSRSHRGGRGPRAAASARDAGSVTSSSPRLQRNVRSRSAAGSTERCRMPSHFHSACQPASGPRLSGASSSGWARKKGYKRLSSASLASAASSRSKKAGDGSQSPIKRCAMTPESIPATPASARVTSCCETPTRKAPVISLFQTNRWLSSISDQALRASRASRCVSSSATRNGSSRSSTQ